MNLDNIIKNSQNITKDEEKQALLKLCEPVSFSLYRVNKEAKIERDKMEEIIHEDSIKHRRIELALDTFKIKETVFENKDIIKTLGFEFEKKNLNDMREDLVLAILEKCKHPFYRIHLVNLLIKDEIIKDETPWVIANKNFIKEHFDKSYDFKEHIDSIPELNEEEMKGYIDNLFNYLKTFEPSIEAKEHKITKDKYYDLKEKFLGQLEDLGLRATQIHYFGNSFKSAWNIMLYTRYGGFGYHLKEDFKTIDGEMEKVLINENITSTVAKDTIDFDSALKSLEDTISVLDAYKKDEISFNDTCKLVNKIIERNIYLTKRREFLEEKENMEK